MELSFNHFKNVQDVDCYLCNPDRSLLSVIPARARNFILRFNTLSEFTCEVPKYVSNANGDLYEHPYYDYIQTRRLINVDKIGWFKIVEAVETDSGNGASKSIRAESCESTFKEVGFAIENRVYKFYDELDEKDESYNPLNEEAMPSVVGQLYKQLGICCDLSVGDITPTVDYKDWTIIWIEPMLKYGHTVTDEDGNTIEYKTCRTLNENVESFGYDFMTSDVSQAFQVFFEFDFAHHAIKIKSTSKVAEMTDIYLSFDNVMKELATTENSQDIVTVLTCEGTNLGINSVNPMGTNYICDFSYYMGSDENGYPWMSKALTDKINAWKKTVSDNEDSYAGLVENLQELYEKKTALESKKTLIDFEVKDIKVASEQYTQNTNLATSPIAVETVQAGEYSLSEDSVFKDAPFSDEKTIEGGWKIYEDAPIYTGGVYVFKTNEGKVLTAIAEGNTLKECFGSFKTPPKELYFMDGDTQSYCKALQGTTVNKTNPDNPVATYFVNGFTRITPYSKAGVWQSIRETEQRAIDAEIEVEQTAIDTKLAEMKAISDQCNILSFFSGADNANLLKELRCYWVDGKYTNDTLKGLDGDTVAENLSLSKELMEAGKVELQRVAQPRFTFTVTSANFLKMPQFQKFAQQLEMGRSVTVEKNESTRYEAALTEMSFSLDESDTFSLVFSNSLKLTDWGFTYADLFKSVSDTSRAVQSNWTNLMEYSREKETISNLLINSLDRTLRAGLDNAYNQEFVVDTSGILGRKFKNDNTAYEKEQLRIINNVIMFTNDNWQTASAALGKVTYVDPMDSSKSITKYGLVAEAIVGKLLMGENLYIGDGDGYVTINSKGIEILNEAKKTVFKATNDGSLTVSGYATIGDLEANYEVLEDFLGGYSGTLSEFRQDLQSQIDNKAETWYQGSDPSTSWNSDEKTAHNGDLWFCTAEIKDEDGITVLYHKNATYRWNGTTWVEQEAPKAVFDAIDGKNQIFVNDPSNTAAPKPQPPFNIGDLWVQGGSGDILRCKQKNESTSNYTISDYWEPASKYTDDTKADEALGVTTEFEVDKVNELIKMKSKTLYLEGAKLVIDTDNLKLNAGNSNQLVIDTDNLKLNVAREGELKITGLITATEGQFGNLLIVNNYVKASIEDFKVSAGTSVLQADGSYELFLLVNSVEEKQFATKCNVKIRVDARDFYSNSDIVCSEYHNVVVEAGILSTGITIDVTEIETGNSGLIFYTCEVVEVSGGDGYYITTSEKKDSCLSDNFGLYLGIDGISVGGKNRKYAQEGSGEMFCATSDGKVYCTELKTTGAAHVNSLFIGNKYFTWPEVASVDFINNSILINAIDIGDAKIILVEYDRDINAGETFTFDASKYLSGIYGLSVVPRNGASVLNINVGKSEEYPYAGKNVSITPREKITGLYLTIIGAQ